MLDGLRTRLLRWRLNLFPAFWCTGARITHLSPDLREVRLRLPLSLRTRNYVGTIFGGSMYAAVDPIYMVMLIENLGPAYEVWDKSARIRFRRPATETLFARFTLDEEELAAIRRAVDEEGRVDRTYGVELESSDGTSHAEVEKVIHVRRRSAGHG
jgi:acyl-coenzyme A thioesterase PaaI-like protein